MCTGNNPTATVTYKDGKKTNKSEVRFE